MQQMEDKSQRPKKNFWKIKEFFVYLFINNKLWHIQKKY